MPTVSEYLETVRPSLRPSVLVSWGRYLTLLEQALGQRDVTDVTASDVAAVAELARRTAVQRRGGSGRSAAEHAVACARVVFRRALQDGLVTRNVALAVPKPRRVENSRRALSERQVSDLVEAADDFGRLVIRFYLETGARRAGLIGLSPRRYLPDLQSVEALEKGEKYRHLPVSAGLAAQLERPDSVLYGVTRRRLETMWGRLGHWCPWAAELGVSSHWLRHTAASRYERATGSYALTAAWLGHSPAGATVTYLRFGPAEIAHGWHQMTGERHPLCECPQDAPGPRASL